MKGKNGDKAVRRLQRQEAEALFERSIVLSTNVQHSDSEMSVIFELDNHKGFVVKYNLQDHQKSYFLQESVV